MKLVRYGHAGREKPGMLDAHGALRDLSQVVSDIAGDALTNESIRRLRALDPDALPKVEGAPRLGGPVGRVGKIICVGLNYANHAAESGQPVPDQPVLFMKATSAIVGAFDDVVIPPGATKVDWEVELGVVIGDVARNVPREAALDHVAGYLIVNDVSERAFQFDHGGQWVKGKSCDTFAPLGPWLVTRDEVPDPQDLAMWLSVNEHRYQEGNTRTMIFDVATLVSHISRYMTLEPGQKPPVYLKSGDVMELGIERLGMQRQRVAAS